jgi:hypothetical protein
MAHDAMQPVELIDEPADATRRDTAGSGSDGRTGSAPGRRWARRRFGALAVVAVVLAAGLVGTQAVLDARER